MLAPQKLSFFLTTLPSKSYVKFPLKKNQLPNNFSHVFPSVVPPCQMSAPNIDYKDPQISDSIRRRRIAAHVEELPVEDLDYCLLLHNISGKGNEKTRRCRLKRFLGTLWTPKLTNYWIPEVDNRKNGEDSLIEELEHSRTELEYQAPNMNPKKDNNKKRNQHLRPSTSGAPQQPQHTQKEVEATIERLDSGLGGSSLSQNNITRDQTNTNLDSRIATQRRQDLANHDLAARERQMQFNSIQDLLKMLRHLTASGLPIQLQGLQPFRGGGGASTWTLSVAECVRQQLLLQPPLQPGIHPTLYETQNLPDLHNLHLQTQDESLPQTNTQTHQSEASAQEGILPQTDTPTHQSGASAQNGQEPVLPSVSPINERTNNNNRIPNPYYIDPDEWLAFQGFRQDQSQRTQEHGFNVPNNEDRSYKPRSRDGGVHRPTASGSPLLSGSSNQYRDQTSQSTHQPNTVQQRLRQMAYGSDEQTNESLESYDENPRLRNTRRDNERH